MGIAPYVVDEYCEAAWRRGFIWGFITAFLVLAVFAIVISSSIPAKADQTIVLGDQYEMDINDACQIVEGKTVCYADNGNAVAYFSWNGQVDGGPQYTQANQMKAANDSGWSKKIQESMKTRLLEALEDGTKYDGLDAFIKQHGQLWMTIGRVIHNLPKSNDPDMQFVWTKAQIWNDGKLGELTVFMDYSDKNVEILTSNLRTIRRKGN